MSVLSSARVWAKSTHSGSELLMLLAIADFADDDGNAYPAVQTLATKCRMSGRNANHILAALRDSGELEVRPNEGPKGTNRYRVTVGLDPKTLKPTSPPPRAPLKPTSAPTPEAGFTPEAPDTLKPVAGGAEAGSSKPLKPASDEPSLNHQEPKRSRKRDDGLTFPDWYSSAKQGDRPVFDPDHAVYAYGCKVNLPIEFIRLAWGVFKAKHASNAKKRQLDWRMTFLNYVRENWLRLWYLDSATGMYALTTAGAQAMREHEPEQEAA